MSNEDAGTVTTETGPSSGSEKERARAKPSRETSSPGRFAAWLGRQSLPRLLGLVFGNTRELSERLAATQVELNRILTEHATEINRIREEAERREEVWRSKFTELADSVLLNKGILPASAKARERADGQTERIIEPRNTAAQIELETEADKLLEMLQRGDMRALVERVDDLMQSGRSKDKRILQLFSEREAQLAKYETEADIGLEVIVGPPEARVS